MGKETRKICLDTNIVIDNLRETEDTKDLMKRLSNKYDEIFLTVITVYELLMGVELSNGKDLDVIEAIIKDNPILPFDEKASREAAKISSILKKSGQRIGIEDEMIASICKANKTSLLTKNLTHFQRIEKLNIITLNDI